MSSTSSSPKQRSAGYLANMGGVAAVDRAMQIVGALVQQRQPLTLTEIATVTDLYPSAILRLSISLEKCGLVTRRKDQRFALGPFAHQLGKAWEASLPIEQHLLPIMQELVRQGMESPSFHVRADQTTRRCLMRIDSNHSTLDRVRVGDILPLDRGAAGRILLRPAMDFLEGPAAKWIAVSLGERDPSCAAVAGPVLGPGQELLGALSLSGPMERFDPDAVKRMKAELQQACRDATTALGGEWPDQEAGRTAPSRATR